MLAGALGGGCCGALFDQFTATISNEYFLDGKGLRAYSAPFRLAVAWTGFRGGLPLGALVVGIGLIRAPREKAFSWRAWLASIARDLPMCVALCAGMMLLLDPFGLRQLCAGVLSSERASRYLICWGAHIGVYLGVAVGLLRDQSTSASA